MIELLAFTPVLVAWSWRLVHDWRAMIHRHGYAIGYHEGSDIAPFTTLRVYDHLMVVRQITARFDLYGGRVTIECEDAVSAMLSGRL